MTFTSVALLSANCYCYFKFINSPGFTPPDNFASQLKDVFSYHRVAGVINAVF